MLGAVTNLSFTPDDSLRRSRSGTQSSASFPVAIWGSTPNSYTGSSARAGEASAQAATASATTPRNSRFVRAMSSSRG
jgi:hypothetical protein